MCAQSVTPAHPKGGRVVQGLSHGARIKAQFEGAGHSHRMGQKGMGTAHINGELGRSLSALRRRSINAVRNHAYAKTACNTHTDNLIGTGITAKWNNPELQKLWDAWCKACDADGLDNLAGLQTLIAREHFNAGESLIRRRWRAKADSPGIVPLRLQVIPTSQLDENHNDDINNIVCGIQHNRSGERTFFHLNPTASASSPLYKIRVPAADMIHLFERWEAGQVRGVPELTAVLVRLYELDEMQDSILLRAKTAALFGGFIYRDNGAGGDLPQESNSVDGDMGEAVGTSDDGTVIEKIVAGGLHYLDENERILFPDMPDVGANYVQWLKTELRAVAKAVGLTYEQLTGDLEGVSYSSIRAGLLEFKRRILRLQWNLYIPRLCERVSTWFVETAVLSGMVSLPDYWENPHAYAPEWIPPKFEAVDRLKETMADVMEIRAGLETRSDKLAERGNNIERTDAQLQREQASELVLDSNPAKTDGAGALQKMIELAAALDEEAPQPKEKAR